MIVAQKQTQRPKEKVGDPNISTCNYNNLIFTTRPKKHTGKKIGASASGNSKREVHIQKFEIKSLFITLPRNPLLLDPIP